MLIRPRASLLTRATSSVIRSVIYNPEASSVRLSVNIRNLSSFEHNTRTIMNASAAPAHDFVSFVNASPTRKYPPSQADHASFADKFERTIVLNL